VSTAELLQRRDGVLFVDGCSVEELAARHGTPFHVVSEAALRARARRIRRAFAAAWPEGEVVLLPAVKANYVIAVQRVLAQEGCGADVFGAPELEVAIRAGTDPDRISLNGPSKDVARPPARRRGSPAGGRRCGSACGRG
jgi:diaminopimelate decarboxylase